MTLSKSHCLLMMVANKLITEEEKNSNLWLTVTPLISGSIHCQPLSTLKVDMLSFA